MPIEITMPRLSDTMSEGTVAKWRKQVGEPVSKGEILVEIETDKATMELESYDAGTLARIVIPEGQTVPIGTPIAIILAPGEETLPEAVPTAPLPKTRVASPTAPPPVSAPPVEREEEERVKASPLARRLAEELGVDLRGVAGTGPGGRITREDVEAFAQRETIPPPPPPLVPPPPVERPTAPAEEVELVEMTRMQAAIARNMVASKFQAPHFYVTSEIDMTEASRLRRQMNAFLGEEGNITYNDLIVKAVALALLRFPDVNATYRDGRLEYHKRVHVGVAVDIPKGLVVPVVRDCDQKGLREIAKEARELIMKAREGRLGPAEMEGSTFTVSNLGMYDVDQFTAIINPPNSGILAVGSIKPKPVVVEGQVVVSDRMRVTLSIDHRVFYGSMGAQFLQEVKRHLENPLSLLL